MTFPLLCGRTYYCRSGIVRAFCGYRVLYTIIMAPTLRSQAAQLPTPSDGPSADGAFRYQLCKGADAQGHGAGSNWLVFLKAHPQGSMAQC